MGADTIAIVDKIASPAIASLLSIHPNDVTLHGHELSSQWSWWPWALNYAHTHPQHQPAWLQLMQYFSRRDDDRPQVEIPQELCSLVDAVRGLQLERTPYAIETRSVGGHGYRMSPKKVHEVDRMAAYIHHLVHSEGSRAVWHAVDVGSGQGYLSRALQEMDFHVLALDNNENRTSEASRWTTRETTRKSEKRQRSGPHSPNGVRKGSLTHQMVHVCPRTLDESMVDWLRDPPGIQRHADPGAHDLSTYPEPVPVLMVALHACGSLAIDVLRAFFSERTRTPLAKGVERAWRPHSLVVVGCCYNLMSPSDFPLSKPLRELDPMPNLTIAALHLAAQVPSQWLKNEESLRDAELALRKVAYRALLQPILQATAGQLDTIADHAVLSERPIQPSLGETPENRRLGKLNSKAYRDWPTFLGCATDKLGIDLSTINTPLPDWFTHEAARVKMESALFVLQTLRCILGPLIESLILLDRRDWIKYGLAEMNDRGQEVEVDIVNLFDQASGSGRNVALVVKTATSPQKFAL